MTLEEFLLSHRDEDTASVTANDPVVQMEVKEPASPQLVANLAKLQRLGLLNGDAVLSMIGQASVDPLNLASVILDRQPDGWAFSHVDFSLVRVLARGDKTEVTAAVRIDLLDNTVDTYVINQARQLTLYKRYSPEGDGILDAVQAMCDEAVQAAGREAR